MSDARRGYPDLHEHLDDAEEARPAARQSTAPIDKDSELHPLVRWQFVGGMDEAERKAFLFTNIVDGRGRKYDIPVVVGAIAANRAIYSVGMGVAGRENPGEVGPRDRASDCAARRRATPRATKSCIEGAALQGEGKGSTACRFRSRRRDSIPRRRSPRPMSSRAIPRPACRTWAPTARR